MFKLLVIYISLLTCSPGEELYAKYGHTAIRVQDTDYPMDVCFNYGIFDFETDNFYGKFVRGETYYQLGVQDTRSFCRAYQKENRPIYEQYLNLTEEQAKAVWDALFENYQLENRYYLYNFVFDNCATRPYLLIKKALGQEIISNYQGWEGRTYREFLHHYTGPQSWADFGINMIFGRRADIVMHGEDRLFLPEELMLYLSQAHMADGTPVVSEESIGQFDIAPVAWYKRWWIGLILFAVLMSLLSLYDRKRGRMTYGVDIAIGSIYVLILAIVIFLTFFSIHPLVGFNWRLLIFPLTHLCTRLIYLIK